MIHQFESDGLNKNGKFEPILIEAIKCHHNNLAIYIKENLLSVKFEEIEKKSIFLQKHIS